MNEKTVAFAIVAAVIAVGIMGFISSTKVSMSSGAISNMYCCCEIRIFDYYGNLKVVDDQPPIRVQTYEQHNDAACANRCDAYYGRAAQASGHAC